MADNAPVGSKIGLSPTFIRDWWNNTNKTAAQPAFPPGPPATLSPGLQAVMSQHAPIASWGAPAPAPASAPMEPWALPGFVPAGKADAPGQADKARSPGQTSKQAANALPTVSYGGIPAGGLTIDQAMKFLSVAKPLTPAEQAQNMLLGRAGNLQNSIANYMATLTPGTPQAAAAAQDADQRMRAALLDVTGVGNLQNILPSLMLNR